LPAARPCIIIKSISPLLRYSLLRCSLANLAIHSATPVTPALLHCFPPISLDNRSHPPMSQPTRSLEFCRRASEQPEKFWAEQAQAIHWRKPFGHVCDFSRPPFARWFVGGETNLCYNAIDRHLASRENQPALHYISTETNADRSFTYLELYNEVCRFRVRRQDCRSRDRRFTGARGEGRSRARATAAAWLQVDCLEER
jgi:hypothetical protein